MIPHVYASLSRDDQALVAQEITHLYLCRSGEPSGEALTAGERQEQVVGRVARLGRLTAPFGRGIGGRPRPGGWPGTERLVDMAELLRLFAGESALLGDIALVQADVRVATPLLQPLLDVDLAEYHRMTEWLTAAVGGAEDEEFEGAERAIREFHSAVVAAADAFRSESEDLSVDDIDVLEATIAICRGRVDAFGPANRESGRYLPHGSGIALRDVGGVPVPPIGIARLVRSLLRRLGSSSRDDDHGGEGEDRRKPMGSP